MRTLAAISLLATIFGTTLAADVFTTPERGLYDAVVEAREMHRKGDSTPITIHLAPGTYTVEQTLVLRPEDSHLRIVGERGSDGRCLSRISGGIRLGQWRKEGKLMVADVPEFHGRPLEFRQLYVNDRKAVRARDVAKWDDMERVLSQDRQQKILYVPANATLKRLAKDGVGHAEMVLHEMWCVSILRIRSITQTGDSMAIRFHNPESDLQFSHPWPSPLCHDRPEGWNASPFYLTNHKALLDQPGEWYLDLKAQKVYYWPMPGEVVADAIVPAVETLLAVEGTLDNMADDIRIENVEFAHATWIRPSLEGHVPLQAGMMLTEAYRIDPMMQRKGNHDLDNQGWLARPASAVRVRGGKDIAFRGCTFTQLGSSSIDYEWGTRGGSIEGCTLADIAGNGIVAGSFSPAGLETHIAYNPTDRREVVSGLRIAANEIHDTGTEDWGTLAIAAGYVAETEIAGNRIERVPYSAISLGWGWNANTGCMHDNRVADNTISQFALHMYDCAGIYTLGSQPGSEITGNTVSDIAKPSYAHDPNHWFWLYTDEGSSNIWVHDNHCPSDKFLQNANGPCNVWENNVKTVILTPENKPKANDLMLREENKPRVIPVKK